MELWAILHYVTPLNHIYSTYSTKFKVVTNQEYKNYNHNKNKQPWSKPITNNPHFEHICQTFLQTQAQYVNLGQRERQGGVGMDGTTRPMQGWDPAVASNWIQCPPTRNIQRKLKVSHCGSQGLPQGMEKSNLFPQGDSGGCRRSCGMQQ